MSLYLIDRACGHQEEVQIYGTNVNGERQRKAAWLATQPCTGCAREQCSQERQGRNAAAAAQAAADGLPALEGTPRQVAWATTIRQDTLNSLRASVARSHGDSAVIDGAMAIYRRIAARETSAAAWIGAQQGECDPRAVLRQHRTPADDAEAKAVLAGARSQS
jgi:hypothetical protein